MAATYFGIDANRIYPQPDFSAQQNQNAGWTASQTFVLRRETWNLTTFRAMFARGTSILVLNPDFEGYHSFLSVESANPTYEEGGIVSVAVSFTGSEVAQYNGGSISAEAETTYRIEGTLGEMPFSQHKKWKLLTDDFKFALGQLINGNLEPGVGFTQVGTYDEETGEFSPLEVDGTPITLTDDALEFCKRIAQGETTYRYPTYTWTETTQGTSPITSAQMNLLGKISSPRGNPPEAGSGRNWMLVSAGQDQSGELYQTSITWELSDDDGHDTFLYGP